MNTSVIKKFAQEARRQLIRQVTARIDQVLSMDTAEIREKEGAVNNLNELIHSKSKKSVIDRVAYTWFNRFCALRFMDVNRYTNIGTVSPIEGYSQPEILQEAKQGNIDEDLDRFVDKQRVYNLLSGKIPSSDPQQEAYRLLLVGACNSYHDLMPFMFQRIADYTELLMPEDLLSQNSILHAVRDALTEDNCKDVEVIGWLYQFYISEKKDEVFNGLKKNIKITPENIPAATQLFTPHWIVQYLVENSLGRLWMLNRPNSRLVDHMEYYIKTEQEERDFLRINSPEELKICDNACGSGHMLVYVFDILYFIYEEEGYDASEIPRLILENNLYGIEIDERAGELAAFCLFMKARGKDKRFFKKPFQPNICVLENIAFTDDEIEQYMDKIGRNLFTTPLLKTLNQFREADNFGSLIRPELRDVEYIKRVIEEKDMSGQLFYYKTHEKVLRVLKQADYLSPKYHVVVANPPYMGGKGMNGQLGAWAKNNYPQSKSDLFAMFIERGLELVPKNGYIAMVTMQSWMFLSSYESLRTKLMTQTVIESMAHMANMVMGIAFGTVATVWKLARSINASGAYCYVDYEDLDEGGKPNLFPPHNDRNKGASDQGWIYRVSAEDFRKIPGSPIAYWVSDVVRNIFLKPKLSEIGAAKQGLATSDNNRFVRNWQEVSFRNIGVNMQNERQSIISRCIWFPYNKGGEKRRWYGNQECLVNWKNGGEAIRGFERAVVRNPEYYFRESVSWGLITSGGSSFRYYPKGFIYDVGGMSYFAEANLLPTLGMLNTRLYGNLTKVLNPTVNLQIGDVASLPYSIPSAKEESIRRIVDKCIYLAKQDWNSYETSWDFTHLPLLNPDYRQLTLKATYQKLRAHWREMTLEMLRLEEENNRIFIDAYGLQDELDEKVDLNQITLTCNPHYRYGNDKSEDELEALLMADTMRELLSYAVGCMFGRYSLDKPGLILANQGETIEDFKKQIPHPTFEPDEDNAIPILDGDWFADDIVGRVRSFLRITFGDEYYEENLQFLEQAIGKDIRSYFLKDFYSHHITMYKKRPIYWMFSSPKGSFNALIYMHRYRPDTVSIVLNNYLRDFRSKITAKKENLERVSNSSSSSQKDKTKALKEIEKLKSVITKLEDYERNILYPLATQQIEIDLDDGVKVNYNKFGKALRKVPGLTEN